MLDLNPGPSVLIVIPLMPPPMQRLSKDSTKLFDGEVNVLNEKGFSASRGKTPKNQLLKKIDFGSNFSEQEAEI